MLAIPSFPTLLGGWTTARPLAEPFATTFASTFPFSFSFTFATSLALSALEVVRGPCIVSLQSLFLATEAKLFVDVLALLRLLGFLVATCLSFTALFHTLLDTAPIENIFQVCPM